MTLFTSDTHQSLLHPHVRIGEAVALLNRTPKILGVTLDTHFTFGPCGCFERALRALNVMKALAGLNRGFMTETLVATYKAIVRPILNYAAPIWFTQVSSSHLVKLEVIRNKALRIATNCHQRPRLPTSEPRWATTTRWPISLAELIRILSFYDIQIFYLYSYSLLKRKISPIFFSSSLTWLLLERKVILLH